MANKIVSFEALPQYVWNKKLQRYQDMSGHIVSEQRVRYALDIALLNADKRMAQLTVALRNQTITLAEWQVAMSKAIKTQQLVAGALANGGFKNMTAEDYKRVSASVRAQMKFLRKFAMELSTGKALLSGWSIARSKLYSQAARGMYESMRRLREEGNGAKWERRVLGAAEHCENCVEYAAEGWRPIGSLPAIGESVCGTNCHCTFQYSSKGRKPANE